MVSYTCDIYTNIYAFNSRYLCNVARDGREKTCFFVWYDDWNNGFDIPRHLHLKHQLRDHPPSSRPGKKRRRRVIAVGMEDDGASGDEGESSSGEGKASGAEGDAGGEEDDASLVVL
ncbi:hypothetical protein PC129_g12272 [Phytophthora cactorum]|uniref:Uncharacterized protein n=1 Tax=Phytophthora cactorum TaxID=29920 RepID=A0A8T1KJE0_9STRA|nr:hypothetical protein Pcac1_g19953 [Phytophthora cactorum]KAG2983893.1 hypothetical protein PC119_g20525 [Phytophthora cactorum]KAG3001592.1 hypothetical protein PC120_g20176 [Phytophthora cactorum]KAG3136707.1 hypothetical protein C6341_g21284 [Phytophthora cactorum]KAG3182178.1 hypothetical protein PC128_g14802 [Phytophthora cactorum]